jgi:hypothetical protein
MRRFCCPESFSLPAVSAIPAIPTAIAAASPTPAPAPPATAAVAAAPSAVPAAPAAAAAAAFCLWPCFIYHQVASAEILAVQRIHRAIRIFVIIHFDEGESARLSGKPIANEIDARGCYTDLREPLVELLFRSGKRKVPNIELLHLPTPSARNPKARSRSAPKKQES